MLLKNTILSLLSFGILISCSDDKSNVDLEPKKAQVIRASVDPKIYSQGRKLFLVNCAECHGAQGEGEKDWRNIGADGVNKAPPLNGTGHAWHHSEKSLTNSIKNGTVKIGGKMPAWKGKLSDREIKLILAWMTAQWSDEIYTAWHNRFSQNN